VKVIYEVLEAGNLTKFHAKWVRSRLHPGRFLELICTIRIGDAKAGKDTRELRIALRHEVLF
jgi:hypothetical protein